jgi:hypothetical protein
MTFDEVTLGKLKRIATAHERSMIAQMRVLINREYDALEKRDFQPAEEKPARRKYTKKTVDLSAEKPVDEVEVSKEPAEKPVRRGFLWWGQG